MLVLPRIFRSGCSIVHTVNHGWCASLVDLNGFVQTRSADPKGSRSLLQHEPSPTRAECFVYAPSNEDFLSNVSESNQELLRIAMDMDQDQFRTLTVLMRLLACHSR